MSPLAQWILPLGICPTGKLVHEQMAHAQTTHWSSICDGQVCRQPREGSTAEDWCPPPPCAPGDHLQREGWTLPAGLAPAQEWHSPPAPSCAIHRTSCPQRSVLGMLAHVGLRLPVGRGDLCLPAGKHCPVSSASIRGAQCWRLPACCRPPHFVLVSHRGRVTTESPGGPSCSSGGHAPA